MSPMFKLPKHYVFDYKPIFYDPKKEQREKRFKKIRDEVGAENNGETPLGYKAKISFKDELISRRKKEKSSSLRIIIILILLGMFGYVILFTDLTETIAKIVK